MKSKLSALAAIAAVALTFTACAAVEPDAYSEQGHTTEQAAPAKAETKAKAKPVAKWRTNMNRVKLGMSQAEVKALLGKPSDTTASESQFMGETTTMDMWTYGEILAGDDTLWSLTFMNGTLDGKTRM